MGINSVQIYSVTMGISAGRTLPYRSPVARAILQGLLPALVFAVMLAGGVLGVMGQSVMQARAGEVKFTLGSYIIELYRDANSSIKIGIGSLLLILSLPLLLLGQRVLKISLVLVSMLGCVLASLHIVNAVNSSSSRGLTYAEQIYYAVDNIAHREDQELYTSTIIAMCVGAVVGLLLGLATCSILKVGVALLGVIAGYLVGGVLISSFDPYMSVGPRVGIYIALIAVFVILSFFLTPIMAIIFSAFAGAFLFTFALQLFTTDPAFLLSLIDGELVTGKDSLVLRGSSAPARYAIYIFLGVTVFSIICQMAHYASRKRRGVGPGDASKGSL